MKVKVYATICAEVEVDDKFSALETDYNDDLATELESIIKNHASTKGLEIPAGSDGELIAIHTLNDEVLVEW